MLTGNKTLLIHISETPATVINSTALQVINSYISITLVSLLSADATYLYYYYYIMDSILVLYRLLQTYCREPFHFTLFTISLYREISFIYEIYFINSEIYIYIYIYAKYN